jgi:hypothetical protein
MVRFGDVRANEIHSACVNCNDLRGEWDESAGMPRMVSLVVAVLGATRQNAVAAPCAFQEVREPVWHTAADSLHPVPNQSVRAS